MSPCVSLIGWYNNGIIAFLHCIENSLGIAIAVAIKFYPVFPDIYRHGSQPAQDWWRMSPHVLASRLLHWKNRPPFLVIQVLHKPTVNQQCRDHGIST